ncbi:CWF19-like protein 2 [Durio zibethinus]|uniref:CWF19-like protein 2 n=1 Tax=Durio zibethinus TaxID=66656 RepID=A0A6P6A5P0_DURZI|nr:CWF19-like protein 2 [Durio zibethinus]
MVVWNICRCLLMIKRLNPMELNPYLETGYRDDADEKTKDPLSSSSLVGDGGASWRLKAVKRAEEQAARQGRRLEEVVQERWGSIDLLAVCGASRRAAAPRAHLHAIRNGKQLQDEEKQKVADNESERGCTKLEVDSMRAKLSTKEQTVDHASRCVAYDVSMRKRKDDDDADKHVAGRIMHNKHYSVSGRADDEYDYEDGPRRKSRKKGGGNDQKVSGNSNLSKRILTQQERCLFCFENPNPPKHLVVAIANFTYLMLPQWQPVVPGHCCILPLQHESATRTVDNYVWEEIRNFKKCLIMMFAKQEKELVFLETVMGLAQQRRHCLIECIPLPREIAKQAPLYFKKAIDEAEDEWSQHNAKKLIDTGGRGLCGSIPQNFPHFHVEFGLNKSFVHVIDDESQFKSSFGIDVLRGMLAQDPHRVGIGAGFARPEPDPTRKFFWFFILEPDPNPTSCKLYPT